MGLPISVEESMQKLRVNRQNIKPEELPKYQKAFDKLILKISKETVGAIQDDLFSGREKITRSERDAFCIALALEEMTMAEAIKKGSMLRLYNSILAIERNYPIIKTQLRELAKEAKGEKLPERQGEC